MKITEQQFFSLFSGEFRTFEFEKQADLWGFSRNLLYEWEKQGRIVRHKTWCYKKKKGGAW